LVTLTALARVALMQPPRLKEYGLVQAKPDGVPGVSWKNWTATDGAVSALGWATAGP